MAFWARANSGGRGWRRISAAAAVVAALLGPAAAGTNYTSSNPGIVSVSEDGLITTRASGIAIITALNDGASGLVRLAVIPSSTDSDGDGIPDDVEIANGMNPNDPVDALEDF